MDICLFLLRQTTAQGKCLQVICSTIGFSDHQINFRFHPRDHRSFSTETRETLDEKRLKSEGVLRFTNIAAIICVQGVKYDCCDILRTRKIIPGLTNQCYFYIFIKPYPPWCLSSSLRLHSCAFSVDTGVYSRVEHRTKQILNCIRKNIYIYSLHIPETTLFENNFEWSPIVITLNLRDKRFFFFG